MDGDPQTGVGRAGRLTARQKGAPALETPIRGIHDAQPNRLRLLPVADPVDLHGLREAVVLEVLQLEVGAQQAQDEELGLAGDALLVRKVSCPSMRKV